MKHKKVVNNKQQVTNDFNSMKRLKVELNRKFGFMKWFDNVNLPPYALRFSTADVSSVRPSPISMIVPYYLRW